jgi:membrane protein DedA with SNARE-associated domain
MMTVIAWLDLHSPAMTAISALGAMVAAIGSWICTVWGDRRAAKRSKSNADKIDEIHTLIESK